MKLNLLKHLAVIAMLASLMIVSLAGTGARAQSWVFVGTSGDGSLSDVLASTVFDLDATQTASYPGTGTTWANLVTAPADGSDQTAYDFLTGDGATSTTYPTFNGTAGSAAAYWSFDGGDRFDLKSGANTTFLKNLHKTTGGPDFWIAFTFNASDNTYGNAAIFATSTGFAAGGEGILARLTSAENVGLTQSGTSNAGQLASAAASLAGGDYIILLSHSHASNVSKIWINSSTGTEDAHTFSTSTTDPANPAKIGAETDLGLLIDAEKRLYSLAMGNEYLDDTKAGLIITTLEARHGRDYAKNNDYDPTKERNLYVSNDNWLIEPRRIVIGGKHG